ncbi:(2Fe-2S) ferredoxin [Marinicauda pacifica]|uniref:Aromatic ring-hydroxylating dioxygenase subunit alpha n=1 Tax=Marinicauda pacifica TaxID=1133559 RepID=A0A4S2HDG3_9PROT|nr:aromatic ring-hydroxylating dioxygenase subunit alpha [Marinicauda pacifica]TGY94034.1 aromatic ring-hydroxylating dioxygenase subunit alpha [Marinicauda pacifica]GGE32282.1 (2Fe-2S) ferredoxin [Marinicauda pacifica]
MTETDTFLKDLWYGALPAAELKTGKLVRRIIMGQPILFGREGDGTPFALRDICPHRGIPLTAGRMVNGAREVECAYHGWRFGAHGRCTAIPSLVEGQEMDIARIRVRKYPVQEKNGLIWVFMASGPVEGPQLADTTPEPAFDAPDIPGAGERGPNFTYVVTFDCNIDNAILGLMDPAHGPYVHQSWYWRTSKSTYDKSKRFAPTDLGWVMLSHAPSSNSAAYKILGGQPVTEIKFLLPGIRTEHIQVGKRFVTSLTMVTPIEESRTQVIQMLFWDHPVLSVLKPALSFFSRAFLDQDKRIIRKQNEGLKFDPRLMLIPDADTQARWYFRSKKAWAEAEGDPQRFDHPLKEETTLRWRS